MKEETLLKAMSIYKELEDARKRLNDIDDLLSHCDKNYLSLRSGVNEIAVDDIRPTFIYFEDKEFWAAIDLIKNMRTKVVEDIKARLYDLED